MHVNDSKYLELSSLGVTWSSSLEDFRHSIPEWHGGLKVPSFLDPAMASPEFFILSDGDSSIAGGDSVHERDTDLDSIQSDGTALTSPPRTHDT